MNMTQMRLSMEFWNTTEERAKEIANIVWAALRSEGITFDYETTGGVRMFDVDNEGRRVEQ
jgi:hypothetical protein